MVVDCATSLLNKRLGTRGSAGIPVRAMGCCAQCWASGVRGEEFNISSVLGRKASQTRFG